MRYHWLSWCVQRDVNCALLNYRPAMAHKKRPQLCSDVLLRNSIQTTRNNILIIAEQCEKL